MAGGFGRLSDSGRSFGLSVLGVIVGREKAVGSASGSTVVTASDGRVLSVATATTVVVDSTVAVGVKGFLMV